MGTCQIEEELKKSVHYDKCIFFHFPAKGGNKSSYEEIPHNYDFES